MKTPILILCILLAITSLAQSDEFFITLEKEKLDECFYITQAVSISVDNLYFSNIKDFEQTVFVPPHHECKKVYVFRYTDHFHKIDVKLTLQDLINIAKERNIEK